MKRLLMILLCLLLLTGCTGPAEPTDSTTEPTQITTASTEPPIPWIQELGTPWDAEGALVELPLNIPNGMIYTSHMIFDGDLMLWTQDHHRLNQPRLQICVLDLDTGQVLARADISTGCTMMPQVLGDALYVSDNESGTILKLDKGLNVVQKWQLDFPESALYMAANGMAYVSKWGEASYAVNLETGEQKPILEGVTDIAYLDASDGYLKVTYYHPDSGDECVAFIDLYTAQRFDSPIRGMGNCEFRNGTFLLNEFDESIEYTLIPEGGDAMVSDLGYGSMKLLPNGLLMHTGEENKYLSIHDLSGKSLAQCAVTEQDYGYENIDLIPNEELGGYFVLLSNYEAGLRLLFWDTSKSQPGGDIVFAPIPDPSEMEAEIQARVARLESEYGVKILVGEDAADYFYDFEAEVVTNPEDILDALDTLEDALEDYPAGFFRQLRYGDIHRTEIHLMGTITATNSEYVDTYEAFVQEGYDCHTMVMDIYLSDEATYYHEFSHIIDSFLEWDSWNREDALFSDDTWCSFNPGWFPGYTWDYSWEQYVEDYTCFVDSYSTINPTEDRARVLEYAMAEYGQWTFEEPSVLLSKLEYYCRCIRDAFDTTLWPDDLLWEQYLP